MFPLRLVPATGPERVEKNVTREQTQFNWIERAGEMGAGVKAGWPGSQASGPAWPGPGSTPRLAPARLSLGSRTRALGELVLVARLHPVRWV